MPRTKIAVLLLLMLAFVSQSIAAEFMPMMPAMGQQQMAAMSHQHGKMAQHGAQHAGQEKHGYSCCQGSDNCFMSSCFSVLLFPALALASQRNSADAIFYAASGYRSSDARSLYRPPIQH